MNNTLEGIHSRITEAEAWINDLKDRTVAITATEHRKKNERNEDSLRDLWDNIKHINICIIGLPEEKKDKKDLRKYLKRQ